jgi:hypothetical protein
MRRSEFFGSSPAGQPLEQRQSPAPLEAQEPMASDQASSPEAREKEPMSEPVLTSPAAAPDDEVLAGSAPSELPADQSGFAASGTDAGAESATPQTSGSNCEPAKSAEVIVVWRPDRRRSLSNRSETDSKQPRSATPRVSDTDGDRPVPSRKRARNKKAYPDPRKAAMRQPASADRPGSASAHEKHRQRASDYDMPKSDPKTVPQRAKVDPNSPFAKLLELRPLLEGRANKRP